MNHAFGQELKTGNRKPGAGKDKGGYLLVVVLVSLSALNAYVEVRSARKAGVVNGFTQWTRCTDIDPLHSLSPAVRAAFRPDLRASSFSRPLRALR